jgi:hypothetical protein
MRTTSRQRRRAAERIAIRGFWLLALLALISGLGCAPVRPEQRAILADKIMRFGADARARAALEHALENREGSIGGGTVQGGGCGCN